MWLEKLLETNEERFFFLEFVVVIVLLGFYLILLLLSNQFHTNSLFVIRGINRNATLFLFHMVSTVTMMEHWS